MQQEFNWKFEFLACFQQHTQETSYIILEVVWLSTKGLQIPHVNVVNQCELYIEDNLTIHGIPLFTAKLYIGSGDEN